MTHEAGYETRGWGPVEALVAAQRYHTQGQLYLQLAVQAESSPEHRMADASLAAAYFQAASSALFIADLVAGFESDRRAHHAARPEEGGPG